MIERLKIYCEEDNSPESSILSVELPTVTPCPIDKITMVSGALTGQVTGVVVMIDEASE